MVEGRRGLGQTLGNRTFTVANTIGMLLFSFLCAYPMWYILVLSFNEGQDAMTGGIYWWPREFTLGNYLVVLSSSIIVNAFWISVLRTFIGTIASLLVTSMVAYALSRPELPGRKSFTLFFLLIMLFSGGLIPFYIQLIQLNLINSFWVYIFPSLFSVWNMLVMRTSFRSNIPETVVESMKIDGAGYVRIYFTLILPFSLPLLAALGLFTAVGHWNDWFTGAFFVQDIQLQPLPTYLQRVMSSVEASNMISASQMTAAREAGMYNPAVVTTKSVRMATIMLTTLPILLVYPFLQRYFVKGVLIGSVKE
ncbi:carbohydrate ABC transporter permease [Paenibacillus sp. J5C_2022]|uniref:carbohydrate ABC transporter permease n=1 Tax=Paenibacillus sp. J5C2022 TaxID=2977129 RepID=UPI0021D3DEA2|nr:carbohydrate ABC transporter permease [Paenibacillus sp. J5C2022]MCU6711352.1 carbohydrate ABC transporter permease [Paenibacillus sp. J5C2022]